MNDTDMMDWLHHYLVSWSCCLPDEKPFPRYEMRYLDKDGYEHRIEGIDIRDCVRGAKSRVE